MAAKEIEEQTTPVRLRADYWPKADERVEAGNVIDVTIPEAMKLLESGKAERADPMGR